jgi:hypothetical protein
MLVQFCGVPVTGHTGYPLTGDDHGIDVVVRKWATTAPA